VGKDKFESISWEQAYKEMTAKLNLLIMEHGPQSIFWVQYPMANAPLAFRFMHALGSPNIMSHGSTCYVARNAGWKMTTGGLPDNDLKTSRYTIIIGRNPAGGIKLYQMKELAEAKEKGGRIIVVDPRHSETAVIADEWLPIKPGTDLALLLAMINVIVEEKLYQEEFVEKHTVGFDQLQDEIAMYPPEWAEKICEIPKETIYRITREFASYKPRALIHRGYHGAFGAQYLNSFQTTRALAIANCLIGNYEKEGGIFLSQKAKLGQLRTGGHPAPKIPMIPKADGAGVPGRYPAASYSDGITHAIPELALRGELKGGFVYHTNPLRTNPNPKRVIAGYRKLDLLVTIDCVMSETAALSHYILPESFYLERDDCVDNIHGGKVAQVSVVQPAIRPMYDTKPLTEIIIDLSKGLGIGRYFNFTLDEVNQLRLNPLGIKLKELKEKGFIKAGKPWKEGFKACNTPSKKIEIYSRRLQDWGIDPIPRWQEPLVSPDPKDPHSFRLLHGKQAVQTNSMTANVPILMEMSKHYDMIRLWINRDRGEKIGLKDGDKVIIASKVGKGEIRVRLTEGIHPSAVWLPSGYGIFSRYLKTAYDVGLSYNDFVPTYFDPVVGHAMVSEVIVRVTKAESPG
jgi:thiosulfate reductase/polysulfide reductase chain A